MNAETTETLDYQRLWKTLLRAGIKDIFSQVRREFFMTIAHDGPRVYKNEDMVLDTIIEESSVFKFRPELIEYVHHAIREGDRFKHYSYINSDRSIMIEYFANLTTKIPKEFVDFIHKEEEIREGINYDIDGHCSSTTATITEMIETSEENEDGEIEKTLTEVTHDVMVHLIVIGDNDGSIKPEEYPVLIKHELTHACVFNITKRIETGYYDTVILPADWTDEEITTWRNDLQYLYEIFTGDKPEYTTFEEFVCEFLMYESDGSTKVKNPIIESRVPKTMRSDAKPKITYRTMSPFDRFQETLELYSDEYVHTFGPILEQLHPCYEDYDAFLDEIRM